MINCHARITAILRDNGLWEVSKIAERHNHELQPSISRFMVGHRSLNSYLKRKLKVYDTIGIRTSKSMQILEVQARGLDKLTISIEILLELCSKGENLKLGILII